MPKQELFGSISVTISDPLIHDAEALEASRLNLHHRHHDFWHRFKRDRKLSGVQRWIRDCSGRSDGGWQRASSRGANGKDCTLTFHAIIFLGFGSDEIRRGFDRPCEPLKTI